MTLQQALDNLAAQQDALDPLAAAMNAARNALKRSRSNKNIIALDAAIAAFDAQREEIESAYALCDKIEEEEKLQAIKTQQEAEAYAQPSLF